MSRAKTFRLGKQWAFHNGQWRHPGQIASQWQEANQVDRQLLDYRVRGAWWEALERTGATLLLTREYEHLILAVCATKTERRVSFWPLPHPSGLTAEPERKGFYVASTRNPNHVYEFRPVHKLQKRPDTRAPQLQGNPLIVRRSWCLPGCLYIHDLAFIGEHLHANAVGTNSVVRFWTNGVYKHVWWPSCIVSHDKPCLHQNHLQLNSIAPGDTLLESFFSASCDEIGTRRPGHRNFVVEGRGVIFSGRTREPIARGLTRPHSARLHKGAVWVDNSGYGQVGMISEGRFTAVAKLPGWTRGLCFCGSVAFVGTSRVIPRFRQYAPGLDLDSSQCAVHALDTSTGRWLGSMSWPVGNQIFAIDWLPNKVSLGFPFRTAATRASNPEKALFYAFEIGE